MRQAVSFGLRKQGGESVSHVVWTGSAPCIDALIFVPDSHYLRAHSSNKANQNHLCLIYILEFVDNDVIVAICDKRRSTIIYKRALDRINNKISKASHIAFSTQFLIDLIGM